MRAVALVSLYGFLLISSFLQCACFISITRNEDFEKEKKQTSWWGGRAREVTLRGSRACSPRRKPGDRQGSPPQTADTLGRCAESPFLSASCPISDSRWEGVAGWAGGHGQGHGHSELALVNPQDSDGGGAQEKIPSISCSGTREQSEGLGANVKSSRVTLAHVHLLPSP